MYFNNIHILVYLIVGFIGCAVGQMVGILNDKLIDNEKILEKGFFKKLRKGFVPYYKLMIIMFIFLGLTVVFVICTAIYLNKKKSQNGFTKNTSGDQGKKVDKKKLENIFNFKIKDNIICIGNRYSNIVRLGNIDYNMLSVSEQDSIENILIQTALSIDYPVQFFSTTEYIDTTKVISLMKKNKNTNEKIEEYKNYLIDYLHNLMENRTISVVRSYAIISYDGNLKDAMQELNRKTLSFTSSLLRAKIVCEVLTEDEIYDLIYKELNKNSTINISNLQGGGKELYVGKKQKTTTKKH